MISASGTQDIFFRLTVIGILGNYHYNEYFSQILLQTIYSLNASTIQWLIWI